MVEATDDDLSATDALADVISGGAFVFAGKILSLGAGFLTQVIMARLLTEAAYGEVVLTLSIVGIAHLVAKLGLDDGVMRELPYYEDDPAKARGIARAGAVLSLLSGLFTGTVLFLVAPTIATRIFNNTSLTTLIRIAAVSVPFYSFQSVLVSLARGARDARAHTYVDQLIQPGARVLLISGFVVAGLGAAGAVAGQVGAICLASLCAVVFARRHLPAFDEGLVSMYRSLLAFSLPLIAMQGIGFINTNVDTYMVGYFLASSDLGIYNIALQLGNLMTAILTTGGFLLPPMLTRLHEREQFVEMRRTYQVLTKWLVVLVLPAFVVLFFAPDMVIGVLFGRSYTEGVLALRIILVGKLFAVVMGLNTQSLIALGKNRTVSILIFVQTVVNVTLNLLLIPVIGFEGAAIGITVGGVVGDVLGVTILYRSFGLHPFTRRVITPVGTIGAVAASSYAVLQAIGIPTAGVVLVVGVLYLPIVVTLALEPEDERLLSRLEESSDYDLSVVRRFVHTLR